MRNASPRHACYARYTLEVNHTPSCHSLNLKDRRVCQARIGIPSDIILYHIPPHPVNPFPLFPLFRFQTNPFPPLLSLSLNPSLRLHLICNRVPFALGGRVRVFISPTLARKSQISLVMGLSVRMISRPPALPLAFPFDFLNPALTVPA